MFVFRAGVPRANVISIVESQNNGAADFGLLQGSLNMVKKAPFFVASGEQVKVAFNLNETMDTFLNQVAAVGIAAIH